jgi:hypothetical protein
MQAVGIIGRKILSAQIVRIGMPNTEARLLVMFVKIPG